MGSLGGECEIDSVEAQRVYGRNLVPNPSFEEVSPEGSVREWTPGSITKGAQCAIESAGPGRTGERCLKVTCTQAGGDFRVYLRWPGVPPVDFDRRFRRSVWVRNGVDSQAGIQVTNSNWVFHQTTQRLRNCQEWTEVASTFTLPAGEDLTHLRLHLWAEREEGALWQKAPPEGTRWGGTTSSQPGKLVPHHRFKASILAYSPEVPLDERANIPPQRTLIKVLMALGRPPGWDVAAPRPTAARPSNTDPR